MTDDHAEAARPRQSGQTVSATAAGERVAFAGRAPREQT